VLRPLSSVASVASVAISITHTHTPRSRRRRVFGSPDQRMLLSLKRSRSAALFGNFRAPFPDVLLNGPPNRNSKTGLCTFAPCRKKLVNLVQSNLGQCQLFRALSAALAAKFNISPGIGGSTLSMWPLFLLRDQGKRSKMTGTQHVDTLKHKFLHYHYKNGACSFSLVK
jgi:hypothetical protein